MNIIPAKGVSCPLDAWLAQQCGARDLEDLPAKLEAAQIRLLRETLHRASHSVFYGKRLAGCNLNPESLEELQTLPFTLPTDLNPWEDLLAVSAGEVERMVTLKTSGTTGPPKRLAFTAKDLARTRDFFTVGMSMLVQSGEKLAVLLPGSERPDGVADLLRQGLESVGVEVACPPGELVYSPQGWPEDGKALAAWIRVERPKALVAAPAQLALLAACFPNAAPENLNGVLASSDPLNAQLRAFLQIVWGCTVLDHYGLTESCYGGAVECLVQAGAHLRELDVLVEIVEMGGDTVLPPGHVGEVVLTTLCEAMPLIRYRTGDVASLRPGPCGCGSPLKRLGPVLGRLSRKADGTLAIEQPVKGSGQRGADTLFSLYPYKTT